jgi:hypothetical protein
MKNGIGASDLASALVAELGYDADRVVPLDVVTRQLTHRTFRAHVFVAAGLRGAGPRSRRYKWHDPHAPSGGVSRAAEQVIALVRALN